MKTKPHTPAAAPARATHTPGRLHTNASYPDALYASNGKRIAVCEGDDTLDYTQRMTIGAEEAMRLEARQIAANAERLALAWNSHDALLAALQGLLAGPNWPGAQMTARAAIAKAGAQ